MFIFTNDLNDGIKPHLSQFGDTKLGRVVDRSNSCAAFQSHLYKLEKQSDRNLKNFQIWKYNALYLRKNNSASASDCQVPSLGDIQNPTGHGAEQPVSVDLLQAEWLD